MNRNDQTLSRRKFVGIAAAGVAGLTTLGALAPRAFSGSGGKGVGERLVPPGKLGVQQFSIRDAITRRSIANAGRTASTPTMGYLAARTSPRTRPTSARSCRCRAASSRSSSTSRRRLPRLRVLPVHAERQRARPPADARRDPLVPRQRRASSLRHAHRRASARCTARRPTACRPTASPDRQRPHARAADDRHRRRPDRLVRARDGREHDRLDRGGPRANIVGAAARGGRPQWYWHVEQNGFQGFNATVHPELVGQEPDDSGSSRTPTRSSSSSSRTSSTPTPGGRGSHSRLDGGRPVQPGLPVRPGRLGRRTTHRLVAWHVKDGTRLAAAAEPADGNPFTQTIARPPTSPRAGSRTTTPCTTGEGSIAQGYPVDPTRPSSASSGSSTSRREGRPPLIAESDSAIGPAADPGRSLRHIKLAARVPARAPRRTEGAAHEHGVDEEALHESELRRSRDSDPRARGPASRRGSPCSRAQLLRPPTATRRLALPEIGAASTRRSPNRPSPALELQLLGLLGAAADRGYPIKVALVADEDDLAHRPIMLRRPQLYADTLVAELGGPSAFGRPCWSSRRTASASPAPARAGPSARRPASMPGPAGDELARPQWLPSGDRPRRRPHAASAGRLPAAASIPPAFSFG